MTLQTFTDQVIDTAGNVLSSTTRQVDVPDTPDYGIDAQDLAQLAAAVTTLRAYLALASPTQIQNTGALKLTIRVMLAAIRRIVN